MEVVHPYRDVTAQKANIHQRRVSQWGWLVRKLQEEYIVYANAEDISDILTRADIVSQGIKSIVGVKMVDSEGRWVGNLLADFTHRQITAEQIPSVKEILKEDAVLIQYRLPEYGNENN